MATRPNRCGRIAERLENQHRPALLAFLGRQWTQWRGGKWGHMLDGFAKGVRPKLLVIGLTGGIATGKSTVAGRLKELGAPVIDADRLAREVVEPGQPALAEIAKAFGNEVLQPDGSLDRARLGAIIFSDAAKRRRLEEIVHPPIRQRMEACIDALRKEGASPVVICDIPLLFESKESMRFVDKVAVVYATKEQQLARLMQRNGLSLEEAKARIEAQIPIEQKVERADYVIDNSKEHEETIAQVDRLWEEWLLVANRFDCTR